MTCVAITASNANHCLALVALLALAVFQRIRGHKVLVHVSNTSCYLIKHLNRSGYALNMEQNRVTKSLAALYFLLNLKARPELKQRSPIEIMYDILEAAMTPVTKTRLMYQARLYNRQVNPYFSVLLKAGLLEKNDEDKYRTTEKGRNFMQSYERLEVIVALPAS